VTQRDERVVLPVAAYREALGVTIALPTVVGRQGDALALEPSMSDEERRAFEHSAATLRDAARGVGAPSGAADRAWARRARSSAAPLGRDQIRPSGQHEDGAGGASN
jgi:hypothetical protein